MLGDDVFRQVNQSSSAGVKLGLAGRAPTPPRPTQALGCRWAELRQAELGTEAIQARIRLYAINLYNSHHI